jgi:YD repeat-containing protein
VCACALTWLLTASSAQAQDPVYDASGFHRGRAYFSTLPFESVDTVTGNVILSFTDLLLPGDAGTSLAVTRTYNSRDGRWRFAISGVPIKYQFEPPVGEHVDIEFVQPSGATNRVTGLATPLYTKDFWRFTKATSTLELPNGTVAIYGHQPPGDHRYLTEIKDPFNNRITLSWQAGQPTLQSVTQYVGAGRTRVVTFSGWSEDVADSFSYNGQTWTYAWTTMPATPTPVKALNTFTPPTGGTWTFTYLTDSAGGVKVQTVKTINGGMVTYTWGAEPFPNVGSRVVIQTRATSSNVPAGTWTFDWQSNGTILEVTGPSNRIRYEPTTVDGRPFAGLIKVMTPGGSVVSTETLAYDTLSGQGGPFPVLISRLVNRGGANNETYFTYNVQNSGHPHLITETGQFSRLTSLTYKTNFTKYLHGRVETALVSVNGQANIATTTVYDTATGFRQSVTRAGVTTTFAGDARGNVASVTNANGGQTTFTSDWGVVATSQSPGGITVVRSLNPDGTVATETALGVTTTFQYDAIGRLTSASTPGQATLTQSYQVVGGSWTGTTAARGSSSVTSDLDGFGRVIHTTDGAGGQSRTTYNADGLVTYSSYPYGGGVAEVGESYTYDALGRRLTASRPDTSTVSYTYGATTVLIQESLSATSSRTTTQTLKGFGDPDQRYLEKLTDAAGVNWTYGYDRFMNVVSITTSGGSFQTSPNRTWSYDSRGYLQSETHPESGTTTFTRDNLGHVLQKVDARGGPGNVSYTYDADGRLLTVNAAGTSDDVTFTYNGLGQLTKQVNAAVETTFGYDSLGRLTSRTDVMSGRSFTQTFAYNTENQLTAHTYPSGRQIRYTYGVQGRVTGVTMQPSGGTEVTLASNFTYHPSGALLSYQFGNGLSRSVTLNTTRQRPTGWVSGPLSLTYDYDHVGNVKSITDQRPAFNASYQYDLLDRLTAVTGYGATTYTYDSAGNRLTGGTTTYTYGSNRLASLSGGQSGTFTYSANGNVLTDPTGATYTHDAFNLTKTVTLGTNTTTYKYGGDGFRAVKIGADGVERYYIRAGGLIAEYKAVAASTMLEREYVYLGSTLLASIAAPPDTPPNISVQITHPTPGQTISVGFTINLTAMVTVPQGTTVARVEYYNDGIFVGQATAAPYTVPFQNNALPPGPHLIIARLVTGDNRAVSSAPVEIIATP